MNLIDQKFSEFDKYLRENFKETTKNSNLFTGISSGEEEAFFIFFLKDLLNYSAKLKKESSAYAGVPSSAVSKLGKRSSVPIPESGVLSIKAGTIPELNLKKIVDNLLPDSITNFVKSVLSNPNIVSTLSSLSINSSLDTLNSTQTYFGDESENRPLWKNFDIRNYLRKEDSVFVSKYTKSNIENLHCKIIVPLCKFYTDSEGKNDFIVSNGILSKFNNYKSIPNFFKDLFAEGKAAEIKAGNTNITALISNARNGIIPGLDFGFIYNNSSFGTLIMTIPLFVNGTSIKNVYLTEIDGVITTT
jgi:hypothetical protein